MKKKNSSELDEKDDKSDKQKALFIQRLFAYLVDLLIVALISSLIAVPFLDVKKVSSLQGELLNVISDYSSNKIDVKEYSADVNNISYEVSRVSGPLTIVVIFISVLYYVVFQLYKNGQTLGKKLMKIKVVSSDGQLTTNQLLFRSFIANMIFVKIFEFALLIFTSGSVYFESVGILERVQNIITFASIFLVLYSKEGLAVHDRVCHTKVVRI